MLCSKWPKTGVPYPKSVQKCRFCVKTAQNLGKIAHSDTKTSILCSKRQGLASGRATVAFLQITAHASKMQIPHNQIINFYQRARRAQIEATARANVPQRCLEQGFARAVICRNGISARRQPHLAEIRRWRRLPLPVAALQFIIFQIYIYVSRNDSSSRNGITPTYVIPVSSVVAF